VGDFERSLVKRPLFSQAGLNSLYTVEPTGSSVYLSAQVCAKRICWYNYITYSFVLQVSNKKGGLAIPLQLAEVGISSPIEDEDKLKLKTVLNLMHTHYDFLCINSPQSARFIDTKFIHRLQEILPSISALRCTK